MAYIPFLNNAYFAAKVGIGTTNPTVSLQLGNSTLGQTGSAIFHSEGGGETGLTIQARTNRARLRVADNDSNAYVVAEAGKAQFGAQASLSVSNITVLTNGNVGIGETSPDRKLHVNSGTDNANTIFESTDTAVTIRLKDLTGSAEIESRNDFRFSNNAGVDQRMVISAAGAIKFNNYGVGYLKTDANGNITADNTGGGLPGGPYLPLTAGSTKPLTGDLYLKTTNDANIAREQIKWQTSQGTNRSFIRVGGSYADNALEFGTGNAILGMILHANAGLSIGTTVATALPPASGLLVQGNVGIGTTSPGAKLNVDGDVLIKSGEYLSWGTVGATSIEGSTASNKLQFRTNSADRMIINSSGNVGIGTNSPDHILCLEDTEPTLRIFDTVNTLNNEQTISFGTEPGNRTHSEISGINLNAGNAEGGLIFKTNSGASLTEKMRIDSSGNVGIGTTTPSQKLTINGNGAFLAGNELRFYNAANSNWGQIESPASGALQFSSGGGVAMYIKSSKNVGIGTTSPVNKQQNKYTSVAIASMTATSGTASTNWNRNAGLLIEGQNSSNGLALGVSGTANDRKAWIQSGHPGAAADSLGTISLNPLGGNVGIGTTSPTSKLDVAGGDIELNDAAAGIIMRSPDGTKYRITVANGGTLTVTAV